MLTAGEKTLCVSFEARMPEAQGAMNICLPGSCAERDFAPANL